MTFQISKYSYCIAFSLHFIYTEQAFTQTSIVTAEIEVGCCLNKNGESA